MRLLFVTRKFPPSVGGMETAASELYNELRQSNEVILVKWGGSNKGLLVVYWWLFLRAWFLTSLYKPQVIYLQDGIMAPLGWALKVLTHKPTVITIHGLEVTYQNPIYRRLVIPFIKKQSAVVAVSEGTRNAVANVLPSLPVTVIKNGLRDDFYSVRPRVKQLRVIARETGLPFALLQRSKLLVTTGRLVRRKGVAWFVDSVMSQLAGDKRNVLYLVSGSGPQKEIIEQAIAKRGLGDSVKLLGRVSNDCIKALYNTADLFIMPNIPVRNDIEGFGLVAVEAASCGALVIAARLEGIQDAIVDGKNGYLVEPRNARAYKNAIKSELWKRSLTAKAIRAYTLTHYSWHRVAHGYEKLMMGVARETD